jgi:hypothetical protein
MRKQFTLTFIFTLLSTLSFAQGIQALKLNEEEVPSEYSKSEKLLCKSTQATILYKNPEMYSMFLGEVVEKSYESYEKKGDKGTVLFFVFDKNITDNAFIPGLLWGDPGKPTKAHPEEYLAKGNILVVWSFDKDSTLKKFSKEKVAKNLLRKPKK